MSPESSLQKFSEPLLDSEFSLLYWPLNKNIGRYERRFYGHFFRSFLVHFKRDIIACKTISRVTNQPFFLFGCLLFLKVLQTRKSIIIFNCQER